jgi:hypothetical protein
MGGPYIHPH